MIRIGSIVSGSAIVLLTAVSSANIASARHITYATAWHQCVQAVDQATPLTGDGNTDQTRTAQFKACMDRLNVRP